MPVTISKDFGKDLKNHDFPRHFPNSLVLWRRFAGFEPNQDQVKSLALKVRNNVVGWKETETTGLQFDG
jgi:hypothetical protein